MVLTNTPQEESLIAQEFQILRAGPLRLLFDPADGFLRRACLGEAEILRSVYVAVRDERWNTVRPVLSNLRENVQSDHFEISFDVECREGEIDFFWRGEITGSPEGRVEYRMRGEARSCFLRNRIGFCVLHPAELAGKSCTILHTNNSEVEDVFPSTISPHQPFFEIRAISHQVHDWLQARADDGLQARADDGLEARVYMLGDVFEMEDQRNWTDASFKTYCTPLSIPRPVEVNPGDIVEQSVVLELLDKESRVPESFPDLAHVPVALAEAAEGPFRIDLSTAAEHPLPKIGLTLPASLSDPSANELQALSLLNLDHLRVDLRVADPDFEARLVSAASIALALSTRLEIALHLKNDAEWARAGVALSHAKPQVARWLVHYEGASSTPGSTLLLARKVLAPIAPRVPIGAGTKGHFVELNRNRPYLQYAEFVFYAASPQVHAFDNLSMVENLEGLAATVESARDFANGLDIVVSPITLKPRVGGPDRVDFDALPSDVDSRQTSLFAAAWTLGALRRLTQMEVASTTWFETVGWRGIMEGKDGCPLPRLFPSKPGMLFPLFPLFESLSDRKGASARVPNLPTESPVECLVLSSPRGMRVLLANSTPRERAVELSGLPGKATRARILYAPKAGEKGEVRWRDVALRGAESSPTDWLAPPALGPYAIMQIDLEPVHLREAPL